MMTYRQTDSITLADSDLNPREAKVLGVVRSVQSAFAVKVLARTCFPGQRCKPGTYGKKDGGGTDVAYRCTLNSLRRLVAAGLVKKVDRGTYQAVASAAGI